MSQRWKVLHIGKYYWGQNSPNRGGIETHLELLSKCLSEYVDLRVVVSNDSDYQEISRQQGFELIKLKTPFNVFRSPISFGICDQIKKYNPDILHLHLPHPLAIMEYLHSGFRGALVISYHSDIIKQYMMSKILQPMMLKALDRADSILSTSQAYISTSRTLARYQHKVAIIPYGIMPEKFTHPNNDLVKSIQCKHANPIILSVGRLVYYKGHECLIRAMKKVPNAKLIIIGEGPLKSKLERQIIEEHLEDRVALMGKVSEEELSGYYHACEMFVLPSIARSESFGIVQLEAMASGKPVINTKLDSGVADVSLHEKTGLTVNPQDYSGLAHAIGRLLSNPSQAKAFGEAGRERVFREYDARQKTAEIFKLYEKILHERRSAESRS